MPQAPTTRDLLIDALSSRNAFAPPNQLTVSASSQTVLEAVLRFYGGDAMVTAAQASLVAAAWVATAAPQALPVVTLRPCCTAASCGHLNSTQMPGYRPDMGTDTVAIVRLQDSTQTANLVSALASYLAATDPTKTEQLAYLSDDAINCLTMSA